MAASMGIATSRVDALTFGLARASPGSPAWPVADRQCQPNLGQSYIIDSFMVVVFGGVGNLWARWWARYARHRQQVLEPVPGAVLGKIAYSGAHYPVHSEASARPVRAEGRAVEHDAAILTRSLDRADGVLADRCRGRPSCCRCPLLLPAGSCSRCRPI